MYKHISITYGWDANGPFLALVNSKDKKQVTFRLSDETNSKKPSTTSIDLNTSEASGLWGA